MRAWLLLLCVLSLVPLAMAGASQLPQPDAGVEAYRRGDWAAAREAWSAELAQPELSLGAQARLAYNLGNCAFREGSTARAGAWYEEALVLDPSLGEARTNLDHVRTLLGLQPLDRGDLSGTLAIALDSLRAAQWRWVGLVLLLVGAVCWLQASPSRSRWWRFASLACFVLVCACLLAGWWRGRSEWPQRAWLVGTGRTELRSEPRDAAAVIGDAAVLQRVEVVDEELAGWIKLRAGPVTGWVPSDVVFRPR